MNITPTTLPGRHVRLEPLTVQHLDGLAAVAFDDDLWRWVHPPLRNTDDLRIYIETALNLQGAGTVLPFVTIEQVSGRLIGSTRYLNIEKVHRRVEIGSTWVARPWQRTPANTEAKFLMLQHAFETLGCIRVELKTDALNTRSRQAIARLGAKEEGTFRNHMIVTNGRYRHSVYFSIIDSEWPAVKAGLEEKLNRPWLDKANRGMA